jgi:ATP/maltotriose-dependent transcriptional regulator MalT
MLMQVPKLAKLTQPRLVDVIDRERLFLQLDELRRRPVVWIFGPPGSGKTTLAASYLRSRDLRGLWYQVDAGDQDVSTFFYYLGLAADDLGTKRNGSLPLFTPEYMADLPGFSRLYFRRFFARLPVPAVVVLDNYHEIPPDSAVHAALEQGIRELPEGVNLLVASHRDAPPQLARVSAQDRLARLDWNDLRLSLDESRALAARRFPIDEESLGLLQEQCDGWAAGLALTIERLKGTRGSTPELRHGAMESIFAYFAGLILASIPGETEAFLMRSALLPRMTASMAGRLTGDDGAEAMLRDLSSRQMFTERRGETYQYHDLFRTFLVERLRQRVTPEVFTALQCEAGKVLRDAGQIEDAQRLFRDAGDGGSLVALVLEHASALLEQGRGETLRDWIGAIPASLLEREPWVDYWLGASLVSISPRDARAALARACGRFRAGGDALGEALACAGVAFSHFYEYADMKPLDPWIDALTALLGRRPAFPSPVIELHVNAALVFALTYRRPEPRLLAEPVRRSLELLEEDIPVNHKIVGATVLLNHLLCVSAVDAVEALVTRTQPLVELPEVTPVNRSLWAQQVAWARYFAGDSRAAQESFEASVHIAQAEAVALPMVYAHGLFGPSSCALTLGDVATAESCNAQAAALRDPLRKLDAVVLSWLQARVACWRDNWPLALRHADTMVQSGIDTGATYFLYVAQIMKARILVELDRHDEAARLLEESRGLVEGTAYDACACDVTYVQAYAALRLGDRDRAHALLREALERAEQSHYNHFVRSNPRLLSELFGEALRAGIQPVQVRGLVRRFELEPPRDADDGWPWPMQIRTLGRFALVRYGEPLDAYRKHPRKPLALLKALIAFGSVDVPEQRLIDAVWPDEQGDKAQNAMHVTINRLRGLFAEPDLVRVHAGRVSLRLERVWVDANAFERLMERIDADPAQAATALSNQALDLYRGAFVDDEDDASWAVPLRDRLRSKFVRLVSTIGPRLEQAGEFDAAATLYRRAIESDALAEEFYRGLMRCYGATDRRAEAIGVYRRLRQTLSVTLGMNPAASTEALATTLQGQ